MLLELLDVETQVRQRQSNVAHDLHMLNLKSEPGPIRRSLGTLFVHFGEAMRGTSPREIAQPTIADTSTGAINA